MAEHSWDQSTSEGETGEHKNRSSLGLHNDILSQSGENKKNQKEERARNQERAKKSNYVRGSEQLLERNIGMYD